VADTSAWWLEGNTMTGTQGAVSCISIPTTHGASLSGLNIVRISILKQSWETFYKISPRPRSEQMHLLSLRTTESFLCPNNKQKGDLSKFPNQSFSQQFSCFLDMSLSSTRNKAKLRAELLKLWRMFIQKWGSLRISVWNTEGITKIKFH
jgi:hypothetical protein